MATATTTADAQRIARAFIDRYSRRQFHRLLDDFRSGRPAALIALELEVPLEAVAQWRAAFGEDVTAWRPTPGLLEAFPGGLDG